jgi:hypothetical protein
MFWKSKNKISIQAQKKIALPGAIIKYGINQEGLIFAIVRVVGKDQLATQQLIGISIGGQVEWESQIKLSYNSELRISNEGICYISTSNEIYSISKSGQLKQTISVKLDSNQSIGSFVILSNSIIVCVHGSAKPNAKVIKIDLKGNVLWESQIPSDGISYEGVKEIHADNNWKSETKKEWSPENWLCLYGNEIVVSKTSLIVSYFEMPRSGLGKSYILDLDSGKIKWASEPAPFESISCYDDDMYLIGHQGYGAFETKLVDSSGNLQNKWKSVGKSVVSVSKEISVIEMDNSSDSKLYHTKLKNNGEAIKGLKIEGYYMMYPILDNNGNMVFFRNNELSIIDSESNKFELMRFKFENHPSTSRRLLLYKEGTLIFSLNQDLYILNTNLGYLDKSSWPCKYGNNERNPMQ